MTALKNRLDSWKAIAEYLGRDVRTVIRWEGEKSLPVHRIPGGKRHAVFAYTDEVDQWLSSQPTLELSPAELAHVSAGEWVGEGDPVQPRHIDSVAVLPFANITQDPEKQYLIDGLTENLINNLSRIPKLRVISQSSVIRYRDGVADPETVGRNLAVRTVFMGRVAQRGESLAISVELINTGDSRVIWGERYERGLSDLLRIEREIAQEVSEQLRLKLTEYEKQRLVKRYTDNWEAYQLYLKGRFHFNKRLEENVWQAIDCFNQALENDPDYPLAYAGLADAYSILGWNSLLSPKESWVKAKAVATKALEIDPELPEAHTSLGVAKLFYDWDWRGAEWQFRQAFEADQNYALAHRWYALALLAMGLNDRALQEAQRAVQLDPMSAVVNVAAAHVLYLLRQYDRAEEHSRLSIDLDANFYPAYLVLGSVYEQRQMYPEAIHEFATGVTLSQRNPAMLGALGEAYAMAGNQIEAHRILDQLRQIARRRYCPPHSVAAVYHGLGQRDQALEWLEKACEERSMWLILLNIEPRYEGLRADPRFQELVRRIGLTA